jgi:hypothetical protein
MHTIKIDNIPLPLFCDDKCFPLPPKPKKAGPNQKKRKEKGISLRSHRTYHIAIHVVVELAIIGGIKRTALHGGLIESVFLMYFHLYIILNITLLPKH